MDKEIDGSVENKALPKKGMVKQIINWVKAHPVISFIIAVVSATYTYAAFIADTLEFYSFLTKN